MNYLDILELARGGPMVVKVRGECHTLTDPASMRYMDVLWCLQTEHLPTLPDMLEWQRRLAFTRWAAHHDLPEFQSAQRLAYILDKYGRAVSYDLQAIVGVDAGELWRERRWRTLLDLIDHLPPNCWYSAAVASDKEHAEMIAESLAARQANDEDSEPASPPVHTWTPEVAAITQVLDAINHLTYVTRALKNDKKAKPPAPAPRPHTPLEAAIKSAKFKSRQARHESLVARMLPHKAKRDR